MTSILTRMVARGLLTPTLMVALAFLIKGYVDVGDGFAAGVVAALGVLLQYLAFGREAVARAFPVHRAPAVAMSGLVIGVAVLVGPWLAGGAPLEHWPADGEKVTHFGTLEFFTPLVFDVGVFLLVLGGAVTIIDALAAGADADAEEEEEEPA